MMTNEKQRDMHSDHFRRYQSQTVSYTANDDVNDANDDDDAVCRVRPSSACCCYSYETDRLV